MQYPPCPEPDQNEPCHGGSGKKYKKCCLDRDQEADRLALEPRKREEEEAVRARQAARQKRLAEEAQRAEAARRAKPKGKTPLPPYPEVARSDFGVRHFRRFPMTFAAPPTGVAG